MSDMREAFEKYKREQEGYDVSVFYVEAEDWYGNNAQTNHDWWIYQMAWQAAQSVPGFVLVPVESAKFCATLAKLHFDRVQRHFAVDDKFPLSENWQPHINALLDAVEAQEKKNG